MRENYPDFLCMKCNAHICCLYFMTSNPRILQSPPLKLNFVPKFSLSYVVGWTCCWHNISWSSFTIYLEYRWYPLSRVLLEPSIVWLQTIVTWIPSILVSSWSFFGLSLFAILSMAYRVLLTTPTNPPNWLLVLPPKNGLNTFSVFIQVLWSNSIGFKRSSRFKVMVNSNLKLFQLRFMICQLWLINQLRLILPLPNSIRLRQFLERIYCRHTSSHLQYLWLSWTLLLRLV
jgi:hypothetical protein